MTINNEEQYQVAIQEIYALMNKGSINITEAEGDQIEILAKAIEYYEDHVLKLMPMPVTINSVVQQKVAEMDITQKQLATMFNMGTSKLSQILNGKRPPDISFLKAVHEKLGIDGNFILEAV
jgi:HTH-type transcriptional regulator / antitoxin HigA